MPSPMGKHIHNLALFIKKHKTILPLISFMLILILFGWFFLEDEGESIPIIGQQEFEDTFASERPRVILITLDRVTFQDLLSYAGPVLLSMMEDSGAALMNVNTAGTAGTESGYPTIGSGARLLGNWTSRRAYNRDDDLHKETVESLYLRHTGRDEVPPGEVLHLYSGVLQRLNEQRPYPFMIGALGESLSSSGLSAAVLGNADGDTQNRQVVTIAMNREGAVAFGDVSSALTKDRDDFPFGVAADSLAYLNAFEAFWEESSLIVIEWGDTGRIDDYMRHLPHERRGGLMRASLEELDIFLLGIKPYLIEGTRLLILSPSLPSSPFAMGQRLTPVIDYNPGSASLQGLLLSPTTRRPGVITNIDIVPSILSFLGIEAPVFLFGAPFSAVPAENHLESLSLISQRITRIYSQRPGLIKGYLTMQIIVIFSAIGGLSYYFKPTKILTPVLYALLFFPPAVLLAPAFPGFPFQSLQSNTLFIALITVLLTLFALSVFKNPLPLFAFMGLLIFSLLTVDLLMGAHLNSQSFLGYDPIGGARFYGMGNEYMGILIGSFILGCGAFGSLIFDEKAAAHLHQRGYFRIKAAVFLWSFIILSFLLLYMMASPVYGANFGGSIAAGGALAVTWGGMLALAGQKGFTLFSFLGQRVGENFSFRFSQKVYLVLFFLFVTGMLLYFLNVSRPDTAVSHLGRTWELVGSNGIQELWNIAFRKLEMNIKLLRYSLWSRLLFVFIFLVTFLYFYPVGLSKKIFQEHPGFKIAIGGIIAGTIISFLVNDSGVVSAATIMLYGGLPYLLLCLREVYP